MNMPVSFLSFYIPPIKCVVICRGVAAVFDVPEIEWVGVVGVSGAKSLSPLGENFVAASGGI
jgi:hypothetical protein